MTEFCDLCQNDDGLPVTRCVSSNGELVGWLCSGCEEIMAWRDSRPPEEVAREEELIRAHLDDVYVRREKELER